MCERILVRIGRREPRARAIDTSRIDLNYLNYALRTATYRDHVLSGVTGSTVHHTSPGRILEFRISLPPRREQEKISKILAALDDKIYVNGRIADTCLDLAGSLYISEVNGDSSSHRYALRDAATWMSGGAPNTSNPKFWGGSLPWISAKSLKSPWIRDSDRRLTSSGAANGTRTVGPCVVLFVVRGSSLKDEFRIGLTQREVAFGQDCKALTPTVCDGHVLFHAIRSRTSEILDLVDETGIGAGRLSTDLLEKLEIYLPDHSSRIPAKLETLDMTAAAVEEENTKLAELRDALLPKLMSGELCVRDAEHIVGDAL